MNKTSMSGFRIWALQDLSLLYILPAKSLQHETLVSTNTFKRCLSNFLNSSRIQKNTHKSRRINLSTISNNLEPIFPTWMALPEITMTTWNSRSPTYFLPSKANTEIIMRPKALKPLIKYEELPDRNSVSRTKDFKTLPNVQAGDFDFVYDDNTVIKSDKVCYDNCTSKIIFTLQENPELKINRTIEQELIDLSISTTASNVDSSSPAKSELKTPEVKQQQSRDRLKLQDDQHSRKYDSSQSLEFRNYTQKDSISQTSVITSKPLPSLFETLQGSNTMTKPLKCTKDAPSVFAEIERSHPLREYHTWKTSKIENMIKNEDRQFFASDMQQCTTRQGQSAGYQSSRFSHLAYSGSSGNEGSRKSYLPSVPRRVFSSKSYTMIQQSVREFEKLRKDLNANPLIIPLNTTRSHPDRISLVKLQSFSFDASKKRSADCEKDGKSQRSKREVEAERDDGACSREATRRSKSKKFCGKTRREDTCVSSQADTCEKRQDGKSKPSKRSTCPEPKKRKPCSWLEERCPDPRKCDAKARVSSRDRAQQDSNCSRKQERQSKSEGCEKSDETRATCQDSKGKNDCKSKYEKRYVKRDNSKKERKCTESTRKRSNSGRKRNSSRASDESCSKGDGKRRYSQQSIFPGPQDRKFFSTLISDIVRDTNVSKRLYTGCSKEEDQKLPSCEKTKRKCGTKEKDEIKKKCTKEPAKCISREKTTKMKVCQSLQKEKEDDKKSCESTKKSCHEKYCTDRKKSMKVLSAASLHTLLINFYFFVTNEKLKEETVKTPPSPKEKDKMPMDQSIKEQIDREYKEIDECKKGYKKEKKDDKVKIVSTKHKLTDLTRIISSYEEQQRMDGEKFASTHNKSIISTDAVFKWFNIQSRIINGKIPIIVKDVRLSNVMFDRSFSTAKLDYQDDFATERTMNDDKTAQNCSANSDDFTHGDELPNYVEIEYEDEEDDGYDSATIVDRSPKSIES
ncbi:PREDICTED: uncharacterized protein LOC105458668 isoform X2 [Wasmannia auropunctata]|uniref:uncharacterized protein LOC105458668 isoform X2 n=1 Tax=Wasmannia auropunctata TaxID=64793 RepID=UPI0005F08B4A|nr:PREDICTED: uncharacterized protein LOC105458668 isoform X2 [Wasmannia auropunctata]